MQRVNCEVRLSGDVGNTVLKTGVSPAEIVILRDLHHGPEAVINIQPTHMDKVQHRVERSRLANIYGHHVVDRIFPGEFSQLPVSLKDIALPTEAEEGEEGEEVETVTGPVLDDSDIALIENVQTSTKKTDLYQIAKDNEVSLKDCEDKVEAIQAHIIKSLFPEYKG